MKCVCGQKATQQLICKTILLEDRGDFDQGDPWNSRSNIHLCDECSTEYFSAMDEDIEEIESNK